MKYGYARVSTKRQAKDGNSLEAQEKLLLENGAEKIFKDTFTGTKTVRPELNNLLSEIQPGDSLIVTKLDRIARSTTQGIELVNSLLEKGIVIHILNMGLMDNTPTGKLIRTIFLGFAEFERDLIVERTQEGKAIARANAKKNGEVFKEGRPKIHKKAALKHALELLESHTYSEVVEMTAISKSTLIRAKKKFSNTKM